MIRKPGLRHVLTNQSHFRCCHIYHSYANFHTRNPVTPIGICAIGNLAWERTTSQHRFCNRFKLVTRIRCVEQRKAAWFESERNTIDKKGNFMKLHRNVTAPSKSLWNKFFFLVLGTFPPGQNHPLICVSVLLLWNDFPFPLVSSRLCGLLSFGIVSANWFYSGSFLVCSTSFLHSKWSPPCIFFWMDGTAMAPVKRYLKILLTRYFFSSL